MTTELQLYRDLTTEQLKNDILKGGKIIAPMRIGKTHALIQAMILNPMVYALLPDPEHPELADNCQENFKQQLMTSPFSCKYVARRFFNDPSELLKSLQEQVRFGNNPLVVIDESEWYTTDISMVEKFVHCRISSTKERLVVYSSDGFRIEQTKESVFKAPAYLR